MTCGSCGAKIEGEMKPPFRDLKHPEGNCIPYLLKQRKNLLMEREDLKAEVKNSNLLLTTSCESLKNEIGRLKPALEDMRAIVSILEFSELHRDLTGDEISIRALCVARLKQ